MVPKQMTNKSELQKLAGMETDLEDEMLNQRKRSKLEGTKERGQNWTYLVCGLRASAQNRRTRTPDCEGLKTLVAGDRWGAGRWRWSFKLSEFRVAAIEE
ncbi:hypothetical protein LXL04_006021 [Taraxacum kok-saghyz]